MCSVNSQRNEEELDDDHSMSEESTQYFLITENHSTKGVEESGNRTTFCDRNKNQVENDAMSTHSQPTCIRQNARDQMNINPVSEFNPYLSKSNDNKLCNKKIHEIQKKANEENFCKKQVASSILCEDHPAKPDNVEKSMLEKKPYLSTELCDKPTNNNNQKIAKNNALEEYYSDQMLKHVFSSEPNHVSDMDFLNNFQREVKSYMLKILFDW